MMWALFASLFASNEIFVMEDIVVLAIDTVWFGCRF